MLTSAIQAGSRNLQPCSEGPAAFDTHLVSYVMSGEAGALFGLHESMAKGKSGHACLCSPGGQQGSSALFQESRDLRWLPFFVQIGE